MKLFNKIAIDANDYFEDTPDEVWVRNENGELVLMEEENDENNTEGKQRD